MLKPTLRVIISLGRREEEVAHRSGKGPSLVRLMFRKSNTENGRKRNTSENWCSSEPGDNRTVSRNPTLGDLSKKPYEVAQYVVMKLQTKRFCFASVNFEYT